MFLCETKKKEDIIQSFELLGWLLAAGLPISSSVQLLCRFIGALNRYTESFVFRKFVKYRYFLRRFEKYRFLEIFWFPIDSGISEGKTLSECVRGHKLVDADIVRRITKGEEDGNLPVALIQIDRDEIDEEEYWHSLYRETGSEVVFQVDKILENAFNQKAEKVAIPSLPKGETLFDSGKEERKEITENQFPVYFQIEGKWHLHGGIPNDNLSQTINYLLLISGIEYWKKNKSEGFLKFRPKGIGAMDIKVYYFPEPQGIILNVTDS